MAFSTQVYNHTARQLLDGALTPGSTTLKVLLLEATAAFDATHATVAAVTNSGAHEVSGNGWPAGGVEVEYLNAITVNTRDARLTCNDVSVTADGGAIAATYALVYRVVSGGDDVPLLWIDFGGEQSAADTFNFEITWGGGLMVIGVAS